MLLRFEVIEKAKLCLSFVHSCKVLSNRYIGQSLDRARGFGQVAKKAKRVVKIETRTDREKAAVSGKPHYAKVHGGLYLGYRKGATARKWVVRYTRPNPKPDEDHYVVEAFADVDDKIVGDANGETVLDYKQALARAQKIATDATVPGAIARSGPLTVANVLDDYVADKGDEIKSLDDTKYRIESLIKPTLGSVKIKELTTAKIKDWHKTLADTPPRKRTKSGKEQQFAELATDKESVRRRRSSANRTLTTLKAALNYAFEELETIADDKAWRKVSPFKEANAARPTFLTVAEAQRLLNACSGAFRKLVNGALQTGARYGELAAMRAGDFNPDFGTVHVPHSKSGKAREIVLTQEGSDLFKQMVAGKPRDAWIFTTEAGEQWGKSHQFRPMNEACAAARISPPIGFHGLRHTWASLAIMNHVPLMVVAENLGHADTRMVEKHYGHLSKKFVADEIRKGAPTFGTV